LVRSAGSQCKNRLSDRLYNRGKINIPTLPLVIMHWQLRRTGRGVGGQPCLYGVGSNLIRAVFDRVI
tara:strand:- start:2745 stop:2945 length:201 start_codon:yes stop_codon:yes gene_type:complete